jgi:ArsR family metal-binding transcriptional regulator
MKINPEINNIIKIVKNDQPQDRRVEKTTDQGQKADIVTLENRQASASQIENVNQAKDLLSDVVKGMGEAPDKLYNLSFQRIMNLVG